MTIEVWAHGDSQVQPDCIWVAILAAAPFPEVLGFTCQARSCFLQGPPYEKKELIFGKLSENLIWVLLSGGWWGELGETSSSRTHETPQPSEYRYQRRRLCKLADFKIR